jgi:hypothetical protein
MLENITSGGRLLFWGHSGHSPSPKNFSRREVLLLGVHLAADSTPDHHIRYSINIFVTSGVRLSKDGGRGGPAAARFLHPEVKQQLPCMVQRLYPSPSDLTLSPLSPCIWGWRPLVYARPNGTG